MQNVVVLGSTGSIGVNTLDIIRYDNNFNVIGLSCNKNVELLKKQIDEFRPSYVCVASGTDLTHLKSLYPDVCFFEGKEGLVELIDLDEVDVVVNALVGVSGLLPSYFALKNKKKLALANKESLVVAGRVLRGLSYKNGIEIVPIDSEHSAIYQCLEHRDKDDVSKIILTASGGPFWDRDNFEGVEPEDALAHPNWNMGKKITIDSATMMNKGFEIIEARWLFDIPADKIDVVIHRQSIVHSAVEFVDGSIIAQIADHDMRIPIAYALTKPKRLDLPFKINLWGVGSLTFEKPDFKRFRTLEFAFEALKKEDKNLGMVLNAADEVAVDEFLNGNIDFKDIFEILEVSLYKFEDKLPEDIFEIDRDSERLKQEVLGLIRRDFGGKK
ncbi:1-deoxy-D-xylulose-5-phosphate reductoisomerase [Hippea maritima]|uniref:1-deoxy-D-xylulose 5-phosphate reductoisomerase n=1 Tax=Hippea maritima (strain ATCC 700847 / DSM 10411 / MH2) TaxID=760142 RepID=F2LTT6_HIPMA|nr:1-deoxy-D-xylulose-5-phosphate reductoisomerase [Hippea maritima]AEA34462.1 1-deoxy-D-xylulose 5-phosphate reductoisomerase [Hippea maritima DSM 10411]